MRKKTEFLYKMIKYIFIIQPPSLFILYLLYFFSIFFPRNKKVWVFGSPKNTFLDNSKYFFLYVSENYKKHIRPIWISGDKKILNKIRSYGYECYYRWSLKGLWYCLRSYVYIYSSYSSDINFWTSGGALRINLWHGIPLKKIEYDIKVGKLGKKYNSNWKYLYMIAFPHSFQKHHYILSTSPMISKIFSRAFKISIKKCIEFGYPRCECLLWKEDKILDFVKFKDKETFNFINKVISSYKKRIIYLPTFREKSENDITKIIDLDKINRIFRDNNWIFIIKQHPIFSLINYYKFFSNITILPSQTDIYMILPFTDLLITDYSSVIFDYLLTRKPIILYQYDIEHYMKEERGFYNEIKNLNIGIKVFNKEELCHVIINVLSNYENFLNNDNKLIFNLWGQLPINANEKLYNFLKNLLNI